ncbi:TauD/TfdA family dioxygenase [Paludisphaera rhizosphaerae]|uniref:TauD/TfdA family dioxygenase n=1 Tax=Paludisphaera rhizosphaerae TaxID=2711216 RepID=UPI0013EDE0FD|nr:TauD/TfdA family dioxygenase [Paludisphaera rhizosphaerae]
MTREAIQVTPIPLPGQQEHDGVSFPLGLECKTEGTSLDDAVAWLHEHREELSAEASRHGAILFRGFPVATAQDFDRFIAAFDLENFTYEDSMSNAVRVNKTPRVFTANEAPPEVSIFLHHELAQTPYYPSKLFFFCEKAAEQGGATPICRSDVLWGRLAERHPEFARDCVEKGLKYSNVMPEEPDPLSGMGRSWKSTLRSETREQAEARLRKLGYTWQWMEDGSLRATTPVLQAVRELSPGRKSFFNQLIAAYRGWKDSRNDPSSAITFGDGAKLDRAAVQDAIEIADELSFDIPWQTGDVAYVDNYVAMHGRRTFSGTRRVLASLAAANA